MYINSAMKESKAKQFALKLVLMILLTVSVLFLKSCCSIADLLKHNRNDLLILEDELRPYYKCLKITKHRQKIVWHYSDSVFYKGHFLVYEGCR